MPSRVPPISSHTPSSPSERPGPSRELVDLSDRVSELTPSISSSMAQFAKASPQKRSLSRTKLGPEAMPTDECAIDKLQDRAFSRQQSRLRHIV